MTKRQIETKLGNKFYDFLGSITDEEVRNRVRDNVIITGGCITSMLLNEPVNDYDLYFRNRQTIEALLSYYIKKLNSDNRKFSIVNSKTSIQFIQTRGDSRIEYTDEEVEAWPKYRPVFVTPNAITLSDNVQLIIRFYGSASEIHKNFDFVHVTNSWDSITKKLKLKKAALESIICKDLKYVGSKYPITSIFRVRKFIKRGWTINAGQMTKVILQTNELDLKNFDVLKEQLIGVDVSDFMEFLDRMKDAKPEDVDYTYLSNQLDEVFE